MKYSILEFIVVMDFYQIILEILIIFSNYMSFITTWTVVGLLVYFSYLLLPLYYIYLIYNFTFSSMRSIYFILLWKLGNMHCSISQETRRYQFPLLSKFLTFLCDILKSVSHFRLLPKSWDFLFSYRLKIFVAVFWNIFHLILFAAENKW